MNDLLARIAERIVEGDEQNVPQLVEEALAQGLAARRILEQGLLAGMDQIGQLFSAGECFVPEMLMAAETLKKGLSLLEPHLVAQGVAPQATVAVATVHGDLHDIGKNLLAIMLSGSGFEVVDLGFNVPVERVVETCQQRQVDVVGLSALLTTTMGQMPKVVEALAQAVPSPPPVIVGGAPVNAAFAERIGAAGYGRDAVEGAQLAKKLCLNHVDG